jgi:hypothetical protein
MTEAELAAIIEGIAPVVREYVSRAVADLMVRQTTTTARLDLLVEATNEIGPLRERTAVLETRPPVGPPPPADPDLASLVREAVLQATAALVQRQAVCETQLAPVVEAAKETGALRERVATLEARAPVPGPMGAPGRDGVDGVGFDEVIVEHDGERTLTVKGVRGDVVKPLGAFKLPVPIYRKRWTEGHAYERGDMVTWDRGIWHCEKATTLKPDGTYRDGPQAKDFWTKAVWPGTNGKDGTNGPPGPPGPAGRDWQQVFDDTRRR